VNLARTARSVPVVVAFLALCAVGVWRVIEMRSERVRQARIEARNIRIFNFAAVEGSASSLSVLTSGRWPSRYSAPPCDGKDPADFTGQSAIIAFVASVGVTQWPPERDTFRDYWGNPIVYRSPSPLDGSQGSWVLYSFGPNGIDDHGGGDDVVIRTSRELR
jgi:hypothetical protein